MDCAPSVEAVRDAVNSLYFNPDPKAKKLAENWLGELQKSVWAWQVSDQLLHRKFSMETCYIAAQTMRTKIQNSFHELPQESHASLRDSLMEHVRSVDENTNNAIVTQLCLALADLAILMHAEWPSAVADLTTQLAPNHRHTWALLEILTVLPEEVQSRHLRLGQNRRNEITAHLTSSGAHIVIQFLNNCLADTSKKRLTTNILRCFTSWLAAGTIRLQEIERQAVMIEAFRVLQDPAANGLLHEAATDCVCSLLVRMETAEEMDVNNCVCVQLEINVYNAVFGLRSAYEASVAAEDNDKSLNYARVFVELGETMLTKIVNQPPQPQGQPHFAMPIFDCVLVCCNHPTDYEIPDITFPMWYRLSEELYQRDDDLLNAKFRPHIEQLINALCKHCQMEPDSEGVLEDNEFSHFRTRVVELIKDVVFVVGSANVFAHMFEVLSKQTVSWESMEAALFIMCAVARNLMPSGTTSPDSQCVSQIVEAVLNLPDTAHTAVRHTSLKLIGELAEWIDYHSQYLERVLNWLLLGLQDRRLASEAALALQNVCSNCQRHMAPHLQGLVHILGGIDNLGIKPAAATGLVKGVALVLSQLPHENITAVMKALCELQLGPIRALIQQHQGSAANSSGGSGTNTSSKIAKNTVSDPVLYLDRLAAILRHIKLNLGQDQVHPCTDVVVSDIWPVVSSVCDTFLGDARIIERTCRTVRFAVRSLGTQSAPLLEPLVKQVVIMYQVQPHSCFLYLGSILVDEYAHLEVCIPGLLEMLSAFLPPTFRLLVPQPDGQPNLSYTMRNHPDTVDDFFRLNARFLQRAALPYLKNPLFRSVMECALHAASLEHREANASVMKFFYDLLHAGSRTKEEKADYEERVQLVSKAREEFGAKIVDALVRAVVFNLPSYTYRDVGDVLFELMLLERTSVCRWLEETLKNINERPAPPMALNNGAAGDNGAPPPPPMIPQVTKKQLVRFHKDVTSAEDTLTVANAIRDFSKLWR